LGPARIEPSWRMSLRAIVIGLCALVVDVYLY
jgi:hypothetical protein